MSQNVIKSYLVALICVLALDFVWLFLAMKEFYANMLSPFARPSALPIWAAAAAWLLIPLGIAVFVNALARSYKESIMYGAVYGLILYGVYDLTNYLTFAGWSTTLVAVDILWGMFLSSATALAVRYASKPGIRLEFK
jgi:uncharacterized membrane protein